LADACARHVGAIVFDASFETKIGCERTTGRRRQDGNASENDFTNAHLFSFQRTINTGTGSCLERLEGD